MITIHFFLHTKFKTAPFDSLSMFLQGMLASIAIGSNLYMILTGFLCCNKALSKKFYFSGIKVLASYVFFSFLAIIYNVYIRKTNMTWESGLLGIFSYSTITYAWYIEMWIGLFILAPFLNIWYKALPSAKYKLYLILVLFALTALPDLFNRYGLYIMPKFWEFVYPLGFYFTGCYLKEYKPTVNRWWLAFVIVVIALISPTVTALTGYPTFLHIIGDRNGIFKIIMALAIFLMFYNVPVKNRCLSLIFKSISLRSLDIFLCSAIFDATFYAYFMDKYFENQSQFGIYYFIIGPTVFVACYILASAKRVIFSVADRILQKYNAPFFLQNKG